ncbi:MAG: tetratricopeptide repeat protein, partial [Gammaproteobacteria bacterium]|nr:tetratricopeptide repeat protein [Gammaproteobacteria bacterium]
MSIFERMVKEFEAGNYEVVIALAKDVLDKSPSHDMAWRAMGAALLELGDITKAVKAVSKSLVSAPQIPETHFNLANIVLKNSGDTGKALKGYLRAVRLAPNFTEANNNLGNIHKDSHRLDQALISYY